MYCLSVASRMSLQADTEDTSLFFTRFFPRNSPSVKEVLANACLFWLLMLYYRGSSLNGWACPSGIPVKIRGEGEQGKQGARK